MKIHKDNGGGIWKWVYVQHRHVSGISGMKRRPVLDDWDKAHGLTVIRRRLVETVEDQRFRQQIRLDLRLSK